MKTSRVRIFFAAAILAGSTTVSSPTLAYPPTLDPNGGFSISQFFADLFASLGLIENGGDTSEAGVAADPVG